MSESNTGSPASGSRPTQGGGSGTGSNRNRNRNRSGQGNRSGGSGQKAGPQGQKAATRSGGGSGSPGRSRSGSPGGSGRPSGSSNRSRQGRPTRSDAPVATPVPVIDRTAEAPEDAAMVKRNQRTAQFLALAPGLVVGAVVGIVVSATVEQLLGAVVFGVIAGLGYWYLTTRSTTWVLSALGARPAGDSEFPRLANLLDGLCATTGVTRPAVSVVDSPVPNAMTLGRDAAHAVMVVTSALEASLSLVELEGVLAHELVHIKREDMMVATLAVRVGSLIALVRGEGRAVAWVHKQVGPGREYSADQRACTVVRYPTGLQSALARMGEGPTSAAPWPPAGNRSAALTRWLWIDPMVGRLEESPVGNLDDTRVRAEALSLL